MKRLTQRARTNKAAQPDVEVAQPPTPAADPFRQIRWLIWTYFGLLIFEGAVRKWIAPALAGPLLIIRDPVLFLIYGLAVSKRIFPVNGFILTTVFVATLSYLASLVAEFGDWRVALFGIHCNFLHLPLVFIMGRVLNCDDVRRMGWWFLALAVPMTALMGLQFQSPGDAWINHGAGEDASMIASINGRIRPSGTFSFVSGIIFYYATMVAFLVYGLVQKRTYPSWLTLSAGLALPVALAVSSSRSTVASCGIVIAAFFVAVLCRPSLALKATKLFLIGFIVASCVGSMALFKQGMEIFEARVEHASDVEGGTQGFFARVAFQFTSPMSVMLHVPINGYGLGSGTNVGAKLLTGEIEFLLAEYEWERVVCESGPVLGLAFLVLRIWLAAWLGWLAWRAARTGHFLPMLLFGVCGYPLVNGQFGQTTTMGFAVFTGGLMLASLRVPQAALARVRLQQRREQILPEKVRAVRAAIEAKKAAARGQIIPLAPAPANGGK